MYRLLFGSCSHCQITRINKATWSFNSLRVKYTKALFYQQVYLNFKWGNVEHRIISFHATQIHSNLFYFRASQDILGVDERVKKDDCSSLKEENKAISILALAENAGMSTGIVTTTRVTHATPASAYAHSANRDWEADADFGSSANAPGFNCKDIGNYFMLFSSHQISRCFPPVT